MQSHFDSHAPDYDSVFTHSKIGKAQRERVYHFLKPIIQSKKSLSILEINCGTGEDAAYFHTLGHRVLATDISKEMIEVAKAKYPDINFKQQDILKLSTTHFNEKFDLIFSNFGGLNCLPPKDLQHFLATAKNLLTPTGKLALVLMPKQCLWEQFYFLIKRDLKKRTRRNTSKKVLVHVAGKQVPTWYYTPKDIIRIVPKKSKVVAISPIGIIIPPSYLEAFFSDKKTFLKLLKTLERFLTGRFWAKYADHFLIVIEP